MWMTIGERRFAITLADNAAARAFAALLPLTLDMAELKWQREARRVVESAADERKPPRNDSWR